jgi:hypothetical protein
VTPTLYLVTICLPLGTILIVFGMRYVSAVQQAKARLANEDAYRQLAARAASAEAETATALTAIQAALSEVRARLTAIEKVLKDVE